MKQLEVSLSRSTYTHHCPSTALDSLNLNIKTHFILLLLLYTVIIIMISTITITIIVTITLFMVIISSSGFKLQLHFPEGVGPRAQVTVAMPRTAMLKQKRSLGLGALVLGFRV